MHLRHERRAAAASLEYAICTCVQEDSSHVTVQGRYSVQTLVSKVLLSSAPTASQPVTLKCGCILVHLQDGRQLCSRSTRQPLDSTPIQVGLGTGLA